LGSIISSLVIIYFCIDAKIFGIFLMLIIGGFFRTLHYTSLNTLVYSDIIPEHLSQATSIACSAQELSMGFGIIVAGMALQRNFHTLGEKLTPTDFVPMFLLICVISSCAIPFFIKLHPDAGKHISGHGTVEDIDEMSSSSITRPEKPSRDCY